MKVYKNTVIWSIAIVVLLALVIVPTVLFTRMLRQDIDKFESAIAEVNDNLIAEAPRETLLASCDQLEALWHEHRGHWSFYVHHNIVDTLDILFSGYLTECRRQNTEAALIEAARIESLLRAAEDGDRLSWFNIF